MSSFLTGRPGLSTDQPGAPSLPSVVEYDGTQQGMENTLNSLVNIVRHLAGHAPGENSTANRAAGFKNKPTNKAPTKEKNPGRFTETSRSTATKTVTIQGQDGANGTVTFEVINKLVFQDNITGETWTWTR